MGSLGIMKENSEKMFLELPAHEVGSRTELLRSFRAERFENGVK